MRLQGPHEVQLPSEPTEQRRPQRSNYSGFGKRPRLGEVSTLGEISIISKEKVFIKSLIGGQAFTLACKLGNNGNYTQAKALIDTGANGTLFIKRQLALRLAELFKKTLEESADKSNAVGYDGRSSQEIGQFIRLSLKLEGRVFLDQPFVLLDIRHDVIIGREFLARNRALVDCDLRTLL